MFYLKVLWLILAGMTFFVAVISGYLTASNLGSVLGSSTWSGMWMIFMSCSSAVGLSLWIIWTKYAKVSGRFLFLRVFGVMAVGAVFFWAMVGFSVVVSDPHYPEKIDERYLKAALFYASIVGASLGVIFSVYRQRFGGSL